MGKNKKPSKTKANKGLTEGENPEEGVYCKDDKFYCSQCHTELPMSSDCPNCRAHIDWDKLRAQMNLQATSKL